MSSLIDQINSAVCNIDSCITTVSNSYVKSKTYGKESKANDLENKLASLNLIKNRISRYRDVFLTDNCYPSICGYDACLQQTRIPCTDLVQENEFLRDGNLLERWLFSAWNPDRGTMISMSGADDDGSLPSTLDRIRFYEWSSDNISTPVSSYIDVPDVFVRSFFYSEARKEYYAIGPSWIVKLDSNFNVLSTNSYGGSRGYRGIDWSDTNDEIYLIDNSNNSVDIIDMNTMAITSTTSLPSGTSTIFFKPRVAVYKDGGLLVMGWTKVWHMNVSTQAVTLVVDGNATDFYYGAPAIDANGDVKALVSDIQNNKVLVQSWFLNDSAASISGSDVDLELSFLFSPTTPSLIFNIQFDNCNNMYLVINTETPMSNDEKIVIYDKNFKKQDQYESKGSFGLESSYGATYNKSTGEMFLLANFSTDTMLIVETCTENGNKVATYPDMCTRFTDNDICLLIEKSDKICSDLCC